MLLDLSRDRSRDRVDRDEAVRNLEGRKALASPRTERIGIECYAVGEHDIGAADLAPPCIRHSEHGDLAHGRVAGIALLDLGWIDVLATRDEQLARTADERDETLLVDRREIAGSEPAVLT